MNRRQTILGIANDRGNRQVLRTFLSGLGYRVLDAGNGPMASAQHMTQPVDAIIPDQNMPGVCGPTLARLVREGSDVPNIFFSGVDRDSFRDAVMYLPDVYYIATPMNWQKLSGLPKQLLRPTLADYVEST